MSKPPRPAPSRTRKTNTSREARTDRAIVAKPADPRQAGLFDEPLPKWIKPCLPTLVDKPPVGPQWVHEIKWDGYRVSAYVADGRATIRTRNGHDWTARFPAIARAAAALKVRSAVIDGEAVILDERGRSSFAELQADLDRHGSERAVLYAFDLLFLDGEALWKKPLRSAGLPSAASSRRGRRSCSAKIMAARAPNSSALRASTNSRASCQSGSIAFTTPAARGIGSRRSASRPTPS